VGLCAAVPCGGHGHAQGYFLGVFDATLAQYHCTPADKGIKAAMLFAAVVAYIEENPDLLQHSADVGIVRFLGAAYSCGKPV
jgi:hypothetical protein